MGREGGGREEGREGGGEGGREGGREGSRERWMEEIAHAILFLSILIENYARVGHFLCISTKCPNKISIKVKFIQAYDKNG